jgi:7 transmembrane sweet-taste receptor of 3 GCPR
MSNIVKSSTIHSLVLLCGAFALVLDRPSSSLIVQAQPLECKSGDTEFCRQKVHELSECVPLKEALSTSSQHWAHAGDYQDDDDDDDDDAGSNSNSTGYYCSNPFASGCLSAIDPQKWPQPSRVCNSEDDQDEAVAAGLCRPSYQKELTELDADYMEIRLFSYNWESVHVENWLLQLVLSELLGVPTTVEVGRPDASMNFYHPLRSYDGGSANDWFALDTAFSYGDCTEVPFSRGPLNDTHREEGYQPCAHVATEIWNIASSWDLAQHGVAEAPQALGVLGQEGWWIPRFTAESDPSLLSHLGLAGPHNRRKVAEAFQRPTTWGEYCDLVSPDRCVTPDEVAVRPPVGEWEAGRYFLDGVYAGYFRSTNDNDCDRFPESCTGHITDYPCGGWTSNAGQQAYHLDIPVVSNGPDKFGNTTLGGYPHDNLLEIWHAANHTKSNVLMYYWSPDVLVNKFAGTDAEFLRVTLPSPTQSCIMERVTSDNRCSGNFQDRIGDPIGSCDDAPNPLQKAVSLGLRREVYHQSIPEALRSPGYDAVKLFSLSSMQLSETFEYRKRYQDPREAVCRWFHHNLKEWAESLIPSGHPRKVVHRSDLYPSPLFISSLVIGGFALVMIFIIAVEVYLLRKRQVMRYAQIEFLFLLVLGLVMITTGAIVLALSSSDATCMASTWLVNIGYTLELVPLLVKIAAINRLLQAATRLRRVVLHRAHLLRTVAVIGLFVVIYLTLWTILDPPQAKTSFIVSQDSSGDDPRRDVLVLETSKYCSSNSPAWVFVSIGWNTMLLTAASVLAFQSRKIRMRDFNESLTLGLIVYAQTVFVALRLVLETSLLRSADPTVLEYLRSIIFSTDAIVTSSIYFFPKFRASSRSNPRSSLTYVQFLRTSLVDQAATDASLTPTNSRETNRREDKGDSDMEADTASVVSREQTSQSIGLSCPNCGQYQPYHQGSASLRHRGDKEDEDSNTVHETFPSAAGLSFHVMKDPVSSSESQATSTIRNTSKRDTTNDESCDDSNLVSSSSSSPPSNSDVVFEA